MTAILWQLFELLSNFVDYFLFLYLVHYQLPEKKPDYVRDTIALCIFVGVITAMKHMGLSFIITVPVMFLLHFSYCLLTRQGPWWQLALWPFVARLAYFSIDQAVTVLVSTTPGFSFEAMSGPTPLRFFGMSFYMFFSIIVFYLLARMSPRNRSLPLRVQAISIVMAVICIAFAGVLFEFSPAALEQDNAWILNIAFVGFIITSVAWLFILDALATRNAEVLLLQAEQQKAEEEQVFYEMMQALYDNTRAIMHDSQNQMLALSGLVKQGDLKGLEEHLAQLRAELDLNIPLTLTTIPQLDAILSIKLQKAALHQIKTDWFFAVPEKLPLPLAELCSIIGNALDNALEAAQQTPIEQRFIHIHAGTASGMWYIRVKNASRGFYKRDAVSKLFRTTKTRGWHGVGLKRIVHLTEKNGGYVLIDPGESTFTITFFLPWQNEEGAIATLTEQDRVL